MTFLDWINALIIVLMIGAVVWTGFPYSLALLIPFAWWYLRKP